MLRLWKFLTLFSCITLGTVAHAAVITWSSATNIVNDADVSTNGIFEYGYYYTSNSATVVLNGVTFTGSGGARNLGSDVATTLPSGGGTASSMGVASGLSANYQILLGGCAFRDGTNADSVTLKNLAIGSRYFVQVWLHDSRSFGLTRTATVASAGGNSVILDYNVASVVGGKGQLAIGAFVADATSQSFTIQSATSPQLNALQLRSLPPLTNVPVNVNASQSVRTVDNRIFAANTAIYDSNLQGPATVPLLFEANNQALRWPGGSFGDTFRQATEYLRDPAYPRTTNFLYLAKHSGAQMFMIANYGTGTPEEAADWVRYVNITNAAGAKYWEIGNEIHGTWEVDQAIAPFVLADILDLPSLASKLYTPTPTNGVSAYVRSTLSASTLTLLTNYIANPAPNAAMLRTNLVSELNQLVNSSGPVKVYDPVRFAGVTLRAVTSNNVALPIPNAGQDVNNRMVLEDAYATELAKVAPAIDLATGWPDVYLPHDPWTYAQRFAQYYAQMKAVDPTIKIGAVGLASESGNANGYTHHSAVNPRTGTTNYAWMPVILATLKTLGVTPDFLIYHNYAGSGDVALLQWSSRLSNDAAVMRQLLTDYIGAVSTNTELAITEIGPSGSDQSSTSLVGGLFIADSTGQALLSGFSTRLLWAFRNGGGSVAANTNIYGWRNFQDYGIVPRTHSTALTDRYPSYYCFKLLQNWARGGDTLLSVTNVSPLLTTYAVKRPDGALALLIINKSPSLTISSTFNLTGFAMATNVTAYSYGIPQDETVRTNGTLSPDLAVTNFFNGNASSITASFAPYSASVFVLGAQDQNVLTRNFRSRITFPGYTRSEVLTNFPVLVALGTNVPGFSYSSFASPTAGDLRFKSADGLADLNYEIETWNPRGTSFVWVQVPRLTNNAAILAQWGGPPTSPPACTTNGAVWTNGYVGVWHLSGLKAFDSAFTNTATVDGTPTVLGRVGVGATFKNTSSDTIQIPWSSSLNEANGFEISGWFKIAASDAADFRTLTAKETSNSFSDRNWWIVTRADGKLWWKSSVSSGTAIDLTNSVSVCDGAWHHFSASHEGTVARLVVDGVPVASLNSPGNASVQTAPLQFGEELGTSRYFLGQLDEMRVSSVRRSTNWIWASYQTVASNSVFSSIGAVSSVNLIGTNLTGTVVGNSLQLAWPADRTGWRLQVQTNSLATGLGANWADVPGATATNQITVPIITTNGAVFYRMVFP